MFSDHDNPSHAAAAAPAPESETAPNSTNANAKPETTMENATSAEHDEQVNAATQEANAAPVAQTNGDDGKSAPAESEPAAAHAAAEADTATKTADAETAAADEEAAGSEEMSKLLEEYDEKQEAAASSEVIEVKVVAYTEHGVVVDLGGKTEGLVPAAEFTDTEIPRPEPNSTIEVQRTGEHKDGFTILSYLKVLRRRTWE